MQYEIIGGSMPAVECTITAGEKMMTESGSMSWMSGNVKMETKSPGGIGGAFGRVITGENIFRNYFSVSAGMGKVAFSSSFPGEIIPIRITSGNSLIAQKGAFLASEGGVSTSVHYRRKLGVGIFGGEGFLLQKISGNGIAFLEIDGAVVVRELTANDEILIDTGHLAAMSESCKMDIRTVKGFKNILFGGEGLFLTSIKGPGTVYIQTMPLTNLAMAIYSMMPKSSH